MANDLIERVARAMCERDGFVWCAKSCLETANGDEPDEQREYWRDKAEAAIPVVLDHAAAAIRALKGDAS